MSVISVQLVQRMSVGLSLSVMFWMRTIYQILLVTFRDQGAVQKMVRKLLEMVALKPATADGGPEQNFLLSQ